MALCVLSQHIVDTRSHKIVDTISQQFVDNSRPIPGTVECMTNVLPPLSMGQHKLALQE